VTIDLPRGIVDDGAFLFPVRVYWEDTDAGGLVYHANYLRFAERGRSEMLRRLGIDQERLRQDGGTILVVRRSTIDFIAPARLDDELIVATRLGGQAGASLDLDQEIRRDGTALVRVASRIACLGPSGRPTRLPPVLRAALAALDATSSGMTTAHAR
jgi:acyl-CoA thioester hydrolase